MLQWVAQKCLLGATYNSEGPSCCQRRKMEWHCGCAAAPSTASCNHAWERIRWKHSQWLVYKTGLKECKSFEGNKEALQKDWHMAFPPPAVTLSWAVLWRGYMVNPEMEKALQLLESGSKGSICFRDLRSDFLRSELNFKVEAAYLLGYMWHKTTGYSSLTPVRASLQDLEQCLLWDFQHFVEASHRPAFTMMMVLDLNLNLSIDLVSDLSVILKLTAVSSMHIRMGRKAEE